MAQKHSSHLLIVLLQFLFEDIIWIGGKGRGAAVSQAVHADLKYLLLCLITSCRRLMS